MKNIIKSLAVLILSMSMISCQSSSNEKSIEFDENSVSIGFSAPFVENLNAYNMALEDIEELDSPVEINLTYNIDEQDYTKGLDVAQSFCNDKNMVGVVGHLFTDLCLSLKNIYEQNTMPLMVPTIDSMELISSHDEYIYQTVPDMISNSRLFTVLTYLEEDINNVVIIYSDTKYGNEFSKILEQSLTEDKQATVIDKVCSPDIYKDIPDCIKKWQALDMDTVFLTGDFDLVQYYIPIIKEINPDCRIYISVDYEGYILDERDACPYYDGIYQYSMSQCDYNEELESFYEEYQQKYGVYPSCDDVQIYDNIMIIAKAVAYNGVRTREDLKNFLDTAEDIGSICNEGIYFKDNCIKNKINFIQSFDEFGNLTYSLGLTNDEVDEIWYDYYSEDLISEYSRVGEYNNEE